MLRRRVCPSLAVALALVAAPALSQPKDEHHPGGAPPEAAAPSPGMSGGMPMMGMMQMMMGQGGMPMMAAMAGHVEGRLALSQDRAEDHRGAAAAVERG